MRLTVQLSRLFSATYCVYIYAMCFFFSRLVFTQVLCYAFDGV